MVYSNCKELLDEYCVIIQLVPSETKVAFAPATASKIAVVAAPPTKGTTLLDADTSV
jgi:hypothetical protein